MQCKYYGEERCEKEARAGFDCCSASHGTGFRMAVNGFDELFTARENKNETLRGLITLPYLNYYSSIK